MIAGIERPSNATARTIWDIDTPVVLVDRHAARVNGVTELRPGVYAFLDLKQVSLGPWSLDQCALTVLATVVSHARPRKYVLDAGLKTFAGEN